MALNCWNAKTFLIIIAALAAVAQGQSEYENCTTNYSVLEKALLKTNNNLYRLTTTFYPPDKDNPLYVSVTYKFLNTSDSTVLNVTDYRWSSASLYLTIHPHTISYLSLLFCYVENDRIVELELELPGECESLTQILHSDASDFLFVITHRLRLHAQHNGREDVFILSDGFEASAAAVSEQYVNINSHGVKYFFAMSLVFPVFGLLFALSYAKGARLQIRKQLNDPENFSTLAALFWVGQTFSIFVIVLDILAINDTYTLENYQRGIIIANLIFEVCFWLSAFVIVFLLSITHCIIGDAAKYKKGCIKYVFCIFCFPIFFISKIKYQEARLWLLTMGFISPLWSASSHLGYVIGGWISYEDRSIAVVILYLFSFVFLYSSLKSAYQCIFDIRDYIRHYHEHSLHGRIVSYEHEIKKRIELYNKTGFNYVVLILMIFPCLLLNSVIVIVGCIVVNLPVIESIDDILTHIYTLGQYTFIFAVFLLTYNLVYLTGERGTSGGGLVNNKVLEVWKYLSKNAQLDTNDPVPDMRSDKDRADSLMAALIYQSTKHTNAGQNRYNKLLKRIMKEGNADGVGDGNDDDDDGGNDDEDVGGG
jgi:hypothetical protein